jgi:hypothetical protein
VEDATPLDLFHGPDVTNPLETLKKAPALVAIILAIIAMVGWFGGVIKLPGERFADHETRSEEVHQAIFAELDSAHKDDRLHRELLEGLVRGECIENPIADLARQGLLPTCRRLGIVP